jgi:hypothetical protein
MQVLYAYRAAINDLDFFISEQDWRSQMTPAAAQGYLRRHLLQSLEDDFEPAYDALKARKTGFFALPRMLFPTITFLGALYRGEDDAKHAIQFMERFLGSVKPLYKDLSSIMYIVYRHGLTHTHMPKLLDVDGSIVGWQITFDEAQHLQLTRMTNYVRFSLGPYTLYSDLKLAIEAYIAEFDGPDRDNILACFLKGYIEMSRVYSASEPRFRAIDFSRALRYLGAKVP